MDFVADDFCPVCQTRIAPKRHQIPMQQPTVPAPPPSSPSDSSSAAPPRRNKTLRSKNGLVQGTGRLRPNGTIKRTEQQQSQPQPPTKYRTVIEQGPTTLYCSDECRVADLGSIHRGRPVDPHCDLVSVSSEYESNKKRDLSHIPPSILKLAEIYNFPHLPPPLAHFDDSSDSETSYKDDYTSGVIMAAQRIRDFCAKPKPAPRAAFQSPPAEPKKHVPGWTDNTHAWRSSVYSLSSSTTTTDPSRPTASTIRPARRSSSTTSSNYSPPTISDQDLLTKYSESFTRRSDSRLSHSRTCASPSSSRSQSSSRRERPIVAPGAEGKLLVPDVKLKVNSASSSTLGPFSPASRPTVRSPLSTSSLCSDDDIDTQRCDSACSLPSMFKRPVQETRSWSYDNVKTYPIMPMRRRMIKRKEMRIVDGEEVEVEVEVPEPLKRLFLFPAQIPINA